LVVFSVLGSEVSFSEIFVAVAAAEVVYMLDGRAEEFSFVHLKNLT